LAYSTGVSSEIQRTHTDRIRSKLFILSKGDRRLSSAIITGLHLVASIRLFCFLESVTIWLSPPESDQSSTHCST